MNIHNHIHMQLPKAMETTKCLCRPAHEMPFTCFKLESTISCERACSVDAVPFSQATCGSSALHPSALGIQIMLLSAGLDIPVLYTKCYTRTCRRLIDGSVVLVAALSGILATVEDTQCHSQLRCCEAQAGAIHYRMRLQPVVHTAHWLGRSSPPC